jgi:diguanylate cyclase (GGDEF)-like protein
MYLDLKRGFELITATNLKLDQRLREITILNEINATVAEIQEHEILLSHILALVVKRFDVESASIMIMADGRTLLVKSVFPEAEESDETRYHGWLSWGEGIAGIAIAEKTVIIANSGDKDPRFIPTRQNQSNVNSLMAAPLIVENKGLGVLNLVNHRQGEFNQADRELLESVSHPVAVALSKVILNEVAITDGMTGLYLKRYFDVRLTEEVRRSRRYGNCLSLLFCDIDHFKKVNDTYGHQAGDEVIITFAERIRQSIRLDSDIAGRWGGEEFAVILPQDGAGGAKILAERIRESVKNTPFPTRAGELSITVSIGVATLPMHGTTPDELVHAADKALYVAKESGRDRVVLCSVEDVKKTEITDEQATTEVVGTTS